jgi:cold shock CspA family protein
MTPPTARGRVTFYDASKGFGFCVPDGVAFVQRHLHLYISGHAVRRAGLTSLSAGDTITFRYQEPRRPGQKGECQDIVKLIN